MWPPARRYPHGDPRPNWDRHHAAFDPKCVDPVAATLWHDRGAPYGRDDPGGAPYTKQEYDERFHKSDPADPIAWPPNEGAVAGRKLDYFDAVQFVTEFGDRVDRLGEPGGKFMGLIEDSTPPTYEARALHYGSLYYEELHTYTVIPRTLIPEGLPKGWKKSSYGDCARIRSSPAARWGWSSSTTRAIDRVSGI